MGSYPRILVDQLTVGIHIRLKGGWLEHPFLLNSFKIKRRGQIEALKQSGIRYVEWVPEKSDVEPARAEGSPEPADHEAAEGDSPGGGAQGEQPGEDAQAGRLDPGPEPGPEGGESTTVSAAGGEISPGAPVIPETRIGEVEPSPGRLRPERIEHLTEKTQRLVTGQRQYEQSLRQVRRLMENLGTFSRRTVEEVDSLITDLVGSILTDKDVAIHLVNIRKNEDAFYHALNVAILSMMLGMEHGLDSEQTRVLGHGALFHDVGKLQLPRKARQLRKKMRPEEQKLYRLHPVLGEEIVSKIETFEPEAARVVRQHHETIDGKGYPDGKKEGEISLSSMITAIANVYDNHCSAAGAMTPHKVCAHMFSREKEKLGEELLSLFIRCLGVYPPGTIVQLSNKSIGLVISGNESSPLRPNLLVCDPQRPKEEPTILDLGEEPELSIERSLHLRELPPGVQNALNPKRWGAVHLQEFRL